jgi:hypothetical protein
MSLPELIANCSRNYQRDLSGVVDRFKQFMPLSNKFNCVSDEVYTVCVGDWIYYIDRRVGRLERVSDWRMLLFILRNYAQDIVKLAQNSKFVDEMAKFLSRIHNPMAMHRRRVDGEMIVGGSVIRFDELVIFSDNPCVVYMVNNGSIAASIDVSRCSAVDKTCQSFIQTYGNFISDAVKEFDGKLS